MEKGRYQNALSNRRMERKNARTSRFPMAAVVAGRLSAENSFPERVLNTGRIYLGERVLGDFWKFLKSMRR